MPKPRMLDHETLFPIMERRVPFIPYSTTSRKARKLTIPKEGTQLFQAWEYIKSRGPLGSCDFEAMRDLRPAWPTVDNAWRARRDKLRAMGLIILAPSTRLSPSGSECEVWVAKEFSA